jgi:hypothetical protein
MVFLPFWKVEISFACLILLNTTFNATDLGKEANFQSCRTNLLACRVGTHYSKIIMWKHVDLGCSAKTVQSLILSVHYQQKNVHWQEGGMQSSFHCLFPWLPFLHVSAPWNTNSMSLHDKIMGSNARYLQT